MNAKSICVSSARRNYTYPFKKWTHQNVSGSRHWICGYPLFKPHVRLSKEGRSTGFTLIPFFFRGSLIPNIFSCQWKLFSTTLPVSVPVLRNMIIYLNRFIPQFHAFVMSHRIWTSGYDPWNRGNFSSTDLYQNWERFYTIWYIF